MLQNEDGAAGFLDQTTTAGEYNEFFFKVTQILDMRNHAQLVQVTAVQIPGGLALAGTVSVQPLVSQLDGYGNIRAHGVVNGLVYFRMQGGTNGVIMDPQIGDIGLAVICDSDTSSVRATQGPAGPGSGRRASLPDGIYFGGMLNAIPTQYVLMDGTGINIVSPVKIKMTAPLIEMDATTSVTSNAPRVNTNATIASTTTSPDIELAASTIIKSTAPNVAIIGITAITGVASVSGAASLNGGFSASGGTGGAVGTISGALTVTGAATLAAVTSNGKNVGSTHTHSGVTTGTGTSGAPV